MGKRPKKASHRQINQDFLDHRASLSTKRNFPKQKWIIFCEAMLDEGYEVYLYEAKTTVSKYITVVGGSKSFKVRFSNHKPNKQKEIFKDCDFFVGMTHLGVSTYNHAINAVHFHMNKVTDKCCQSG